MRNVSPILRTSEKAPLVRTDFSNDAAWAALKAQASAPAGEFQANLEFIEDRSFNGVSPDELAEDLNGKGERSFVLLADAASMTQPGYPIICLDLLDEPGRTFRFVASQAWSVENNLSLANIDFRDFVNSVDATGVFKGFDK